jgi:hypothetical protein
MKPFCEIRHLIRDPVLGGSVFTNADQTGSITLSVTIMSR